MLLTKNVLFSHCFFHTLFSRFNPFPHGCWCNFGEHLMQGHGPPVNTFDAICKDFSRCLKCARFDGKKENFGCDPVVQTYQTGAGPDFVTKCSAGNPDDQCAVYVCSCESTIIAEIMDLAFQPHTPENEYSDEFLHSNGFEYDSMCPVAAVTFDEGNDCCGVYPKRFPYALGNPSKTCCKDSSLYSAFKNFGPVSKFGHFWRFSA